MRTRIFLLFILAVAMLISCNSEEISTSNSNEDLGTEQIAHDSALIESVDTSSVLAEVNATEIPIGNEDTLYSVESDWQYNLQTEPTLIQFENFDIQIGHYFSTEELSSDTIMVSEDVGEYLDGQEFKIKPKNIQDTFHLYVRTVNNIFEMMDSDSLGLLEDWETWDQFEYIDTSERYYWKPLSQNDYIFPSMSYIFSQKTEELKFSDTTYWYHGEMSGTYFGSAFLFDGHIVDYYIYSAFVIIERHNNGLQESKVLRVDFSYGC